MHLGATNVQLRHAGQPTQRIAASSRAAHRARRCLKSAITSVVCLPEHTAALRAWLGAITPGMLDDPVHLAVLAATAENAAQRSIKEDLKRSSNSWRTWLKEGPASGLGRQHRMSRVATGWIAAATAQPCQDGMGNDPDDWLSDLCELETDAKSMARIMEPPDAAGEMPLNRQQSVDAESSKW
jgi:hypothetical protein